MQEDLMNEIQGEIEYMNPYKEWTDQFANWIYDLTDYYKLSEDNQKYLIEWYGKVQ